MNAPYKDGPSTCPKCGAPTNYTASSDTESQGYFGTHRFSGATRADVLREALAWLGLDYHTESEITEAINHATETLGEDP